MINIFNQELQEIYSFFKNNYKETVILCAATLFLILVSTQPIRSSLVINYLIYFAILPVLTILIILRKNSLDYGLRIGNYKLWGLYIALTVIIGIPILYVGAHFSSISHYYTRRFDYYSFLTQMVPLLFAWDFCFAVFFCSGLRKNLKRRVYSSKWFHLRFFILENLK